MFKSRFAGPAIAILISISFIGWMLSGHEPNSTQNTAKDATEKSLIPTVQVINSQARQVRQTLKINGITEAARFVTIRSEASGKVIKVVTRNSQNVEAGDIIAQLDAGDIPARIRQAKAFIEQARLEYEGAKQLRSQALLNEAQLAARLANYEQAKAQLVSLEQQYAHTFIRAPFAGQVESMNLEIGSYVRPGDAIADIYDYTTLKFVGSVSEKDIASVSLGQTAQVRLINGQRAEATVSYIDSVTNPATRTFDVELAVTSFERNVSGVTSEATIDLDFVKGHYISPALLFINNEGQLGLKTLNTLNEVEFYETDIIHSDTNGVWISGLPTSARIIVVGQGFVNIGERTAPNEVAFDPNVAVGL